MARGLCNVLPGPLLALRPETGNLSAKRGHFAGQIGFRKRWESAAMRRSPCAGKLVERIEKVLR